jgi:hypothetical protein
MNPSNRFTSSSDSGLKPSDVEATLRLIANLPAPEGLEDRVRAALRTAPRTARVLAWPTALGRGSAWMRTAAAAAIAVVVAGGGWGIYVRVLPSQVIAMPQHAGASGGFSSAGAMRTPQTLNGPAAPHAAAPAQAKTPSRSAQASARHGQAAKIAAMPPKAPAAPVQ